VRIESVHSVRHNVVAMLDHAEAVSQPGTWGAANPIRALDSASKLGPSSMNIEVAKVLPHCCDT